MEQSLRELLEQQILMRTEEEKTKIFISEAIDKMGKISKGKRLTVKEMVHHLEQTSPYLQETEETESVNDNIVDVADQRRKLRERESCKVGKSLNGKCRSVSRSTRTPVQSLQDEMDRFETNLLLGLLSKFQKNIDLTSRSSIYTPSYYVPIYSVLLSINFPVSSECLEFVILNHLPPFLFQMLLSRYSPSTSIYRQKESGQTFYHLIADSGSDKLLEMTHEYYSRSSPDSNVYLQRDRTSRTPVDIACLSGSYKVLTFFHKLLGSEMLVSAHDADRETPLLLCTYHDRSRQCLEYILKSVEAPALTGLLSSAIYSSISHNAVEVGKVLLQHYDPTSLWKQNSSHQRSDKYWLEGTQLSSWCVDMSLGKEKYRVILDIRDIDQCKAIYLSPCLHNQVKHEDLNFISSEDKDNQVLRKKSRKSDPPIYSENGFHNTRRSSRKSILVVPSYSIKRKNERTMKKDIPLTAESKPPRESPKKRKMDTVTEKMSDDVQKSRYSDRVGALFSGENVQLLIENSDWQITPYMFDFLHSSACTQEILPRFIYSTEPYWGCDSIYQDSMKSHTESVQQDNSGVVGTDCGTAYQCCCKCVGDCAKNPNCPCIMRSVH